MTSYITVLVAMIGLLALLALLATSFFFGVSSRNRDMEHLGYFKETYLSKSGYSLNTNYSLRSLDGGKNWYAVERTDEGGILVLGTADEIFPGLLKHLNGMDALIEYVERNGAITFSGDRRPEEISIMENAGFEVKYDGGTE